MVEVWHGVAPNTDAGGAAALAKRASASLLEASQSSCCALRVVPPLSRRPAAFSRRLAARRCLHALAPRLACSARCGARAAGHPGDTQPAAALIAQRWGSECQRGADVATEGWSKGVVAGCLRVSRRAQNDQLRRRGPPLRTALASRCPPHCAHGLVIAEETWRRASCSNVIVPGTSPLGQIGPDLLARRSSTTSAFATWA